MARGFDEIISFQFVKNGLSRQREHGYQGWITVWYLIILNTVSPISTAKPAGLCFRKKLELVVTGRKHQNWIQAYLIPEHKTVYQKQHSLIHWTISYNSNWLFCTENKKDKHYIMLSCCSTTAFSHTPPKTGQIMIWHRPSVDNF